MYNAKWVSISSPIYIGDKMKYFKRKDGSVFGKVDTISQETIDKFIKNGCQPCNEKGEVKKPKRKLSLKKKK
jgi:hypothetical protein|tara:strand:- start:77 stop:292 length:216 start_codon:yes stop_codon:yes gene_type:complete